MVAREHPQVGHCLRDCKHFCTGRNGHGCGARAREIARAYLRRYLRLSNYVNSWRRAGFDDGDFADNGSNRLVGTLVAWGDEDALVGRIREHWQAGADHICIQALHADQSKSTFDGPNSDLLPGLAPLPRESNTHECASTAPTDRWNR